MFTNCLSREREREKPHVRHYRERRQGAGLSFLSPGLPEGGPRRKSSDLTDWRAE